MPFNDDHTNNILNMGEDNFQMCKWAFNLLTHTQFHLC